MESLVGFGWKIIAVLALFTIVFGLRRAGSGAELNVGARSRERRRERRQARRASQQT